MSLVPQLQNGTIIVPKAYHLIRIKSITTCKALKSQPSSWKTLNKFIQHAFNKYLLTTYFMLDAVLRMQQQMNKDSSLLLSRPVILKLDQISELLSGLIKTQGNEPQL